MSSKMKILAAATLLVLSAQAGAQVTFYEHNNYAGRSFKTQNKVNNLQRYGFNDLASSVVVSGKRWEVCDQQNFEGRCVILRPGNYLTLSSMGLNDRISSARAVGANMQYEEDRYAPAPVSVYDSRRRNNERLYEAEVTSARAVMGQPQQRCWTEQQQVQQDSNANVPGALVGAVLGGVLGHQVGGGRGRDLATVGGVVAGAAVGSRVGGDSNSTRTQDIQRCSSQASNGPPEYWDVGYQFRGQDHHVQMRQRPGKTVIVNRQGEPRS
jgi:uncharacterized protein YcfJ